ncbi:MAG TPA: hypothetical protein VNO55_09195 [Polyangia bacterium]|nr:hypothetical protein [Polyangia bacterium]
MTIGLLAAGLTWTAAVGCGDGDGTDTAPASIGQAKSAVMLGAGPVNRLDEFVRSGGELYWRFSGTFEHDYVNVGNRGVALISDPAVVSWGTGRVDVFAINQNNTIEHGGIDGNGAFAWWDNWDSPAPGRSLSGISAVSGRSGLLDLFVVDTAPYVGTNNLYHRRWDNWTDTGWQLMTGSGTNGAPRNFGAPGAIAGGSNGPESYDVFVKGFNQATSRWNIYHVNSTNGGFTVEPWDNLGEPGGAALASDPRGASWSNGRMDVVVSDTAGAIRHIYTGLCDQHTPWNCTHYQWFWNTWTAPPVGSAPTIVTMGPNKLSVFARQASDSGLIQCTWDSQDLGCKSLGGWLEGGPGASSQAAPYCDGQPICFVPQTGKIWDSSGNYNPSTADLANIVSQINIPRRQSIVNMALLQTRWYGRDGQIWGGDGTTGACGDPARKIYGASTWPVSVEWCTEFARTVLRWGGAANINDLWDATDVDDMQEVFQPYGWWIERNAFNANSFWNGAEAGDYLTVVGSSGNHFGHSAIIVGVSDDKRWLFTVEGNVDDCVMYQRRPYMVNGQLADNIDAFGKADLF